MTSIPHFSAEPGAVDLDPSTLEMVLALLQTTTGRKHSLLADCAMPLNGTAASKRLPVRSPAGSLWLVSEGEDCPWLPEAVRLIEHTLDSHFRSQRSIATLTSLYDVGLVISSSLELEKVLTKVLAKSVELLGAEHGSLLMLDEVRSELKLLQLSSTEEPSITTTRVELDENLHAWIKEQGCVDRNADRARLALAVQLMSKNQVVGALTLTGRFDDSDFSSDDEKVLGILASHAASAIANAQLYARVERQVSELEALHHLGQVLNASLALDEILPELLDQALQLLDAEAASVMLLDPASQTLSIKISRGLPAEVIETTRVAVGDRISGRVAQERKARLFRRKDGEGDSALCVPLVTSDRLLGVLNIRDKKDGGDFSNEDLSLALRLASVAALSLAKAELHDELEQMFVNAIRALANAIDARDPYTSGHSDRVTEYSVLMGERMNFSSSDLDDLRNAALLHDIGKIRIRDHILHKPGKLTEEEFDEIKMHPQYGVDIMEPVQAFRHILPYMLHHHERFDGKGYPTGLRGDAIPLQARIMCVADCFDAMTSDRPYRQGMPVPLAVQELERNRGTQFDPEAVAVFLDLIKEGKVQPIVERQ